MAMMDSFRRLILPDFVRIGVNGRRYFGRKSVITLKVNYRFLAPTDLEPHLMPSGNDFLNRLMSDRG